MSTIFNKCENCRRIVGQGSNFFLDNGSYICTLCGCVQRTNGFHNANADNRYFQDTPQYFARSRESELMSHMLSRVCPEETRENKCKKRIYDICEKLDIIERVRNRAWLLFKRNKSFLGLRPQNNVALATICIAMYSLKIPYDLNYYESILGLKNVSAMIKNISKKLKINLKLDAAMLIPMWLSMFGKSYGNLRKINRELRRMSRKHPSIGSQTRLAITFHNCFPDLSISLISERTGISETSLKNIKEKNLKYI